jgi:hypothetical protein
MENQKQEITFGAPANGCRWSQMWLKMIECIEREVITPNHKFPTYHKFVQGTMHESSQSFNYIKPIPAPFVYDTYSIREDIKAYILEKLGPSAAIEEVQQKCASIMNFYMQMIAATPDNYPGFFVKHWSACTQGVRKTTINRCSHPEDNDTFDRNCANNPVVFLFCVKLIKVNDHVQPDPDQWAVNFLKVTMTWNNVEKRFNLNDVDIKGCPPIDVANAVTA